MGGLELFIHVNVGEVRVVFFLFVCFSRILEMKGKLELGQKLLKFVCQLSRS